MQSADQSTRRAFPRLNESPATFEGLISGLVRARSGAVVSAMRDGDFSALETSRAAATGTAQPHEAILRVHMVSPYGPLGRGGIDRVADSLIHALIARPDLRVHVTRLTSRGTGKLIWAPWFLMRVLASLAVACRRHEIDLLHIHLSWRGSTYRKIIIAAWARMLGVPYVVHLHAGGFARFWSGSRWPVRLAIDRLFEESTGIIVLGRYWADVVAQKLPSVRARIAILPNATPRPTVAHVPAPDGRVRISFAGKLCAEKGVPELIAALAQLAERDDWTATIAGNGAVKEASLDLQRCGLAQRVSVPGWLDPAGIERLLASTDIFVLPSHFENFPLSLVEASAFGTAIIATPVGAVGELIEHGRNGLLVPVGDAGVLASALRRLLDDPGLREKLGESARQHHMEKYEMADYLVRLATVWRRAVLSRP